MPDPLQRLIRDLRRESCPREVLDRVAERVVRQRRASRDARPWLPWLAGACVVALAAGAIWQWPARPDLSHPAPEITSVDRTLVLRQTQGALLQIGHVLLDAALHAENAVLEDALPPLRDSFLTARDKIIH